MNVETGEIKPKDKLTRQEIKSGLWVGMDKRPNPGCKHCHGRGYTGLDIAKNKLIICKCVKKRPKK